MEFTGRNEQRTIAKSESLDSYIKEKKLSLGTKISSHKKIYLDTKFWVQIRDSRMGRSTNPNITQLAEFLLDAAKTERLICPISADILSEILKQKDPKTLRSSISVVDALSRGVNRPSPGRRFAALNSGMHRRRHEQ